MEKRIEKWYYFIVFIRILSFEVAGALLILFWQDRGMSLFQSSILIAVSAVTILLAEIPTGAIADLYGRRISVVLGFILYIIFSVINIYSFSFYKFAIATVISGIAFTLHSGALEAWVVDTIKHHNNRINLGEIFSRAGIIRNGGLMVSGIIGAYLAHMDFNYIWISSIVLSLLSAIICMIVMKEPYFNKDELLKTKNTNSFRTQISSSWSYVVQNKVIFSFIIITLLISFSSSAANCFQQPRFKILWGDGIWIIGWIRVGYSIMMMLGSHFIGYLTRKGNSDNQIIMYTCATLGIWLVLSGLFNSFSSVLVTFYIYEFGRGMYNPAKQIFLNKRINGDKRATFLSFQSAIAQLGMIFGLIITGYITHIIGSNNSEFAIRISWGVCGLIALIGAVIALSLRNKDECTSVVDLSQ